MPEIVVTLDIGGSGVKASSFDPAGDFPPTAISVRYPPVVPQEEGTFDPYVWAETAIAALAQLVARCPALPRHYLGITVSAIRIPFVLLDADQRVVGPSLLNRDRRALPIVNGLVSSIGHRTLHLTTGHWAAPEFGLPKLIWIQRTIPGAWGQVRTIMQLHDWFIFSLCGTIASEASSAAMSQMMNISAGTWAYDLLASECGVRDEMMPQFAAAGTRAGGLLRTVAQQVGLPAGLPVHLGAGDTHMSALAVGGQASGCPVVVAGTTGPAQLSVDTAADIEAWFPLLVSALPGTTGWALESNAGPTGEIVDRLNDLTELSGPSLQTALEARGFTIDDAADRAEPLTVLAGNPHFGPSGWHVWPAPTVFGLSPRHTGADLLDAARSGTCLAFSQVLNQLSSAFEFRGDTVIATGGMSRSATWNQALANVTGRTVLVRELDQVSALAGAALVAGVSVESALHGLGAARYTPDATKYAGLQRSAEDYRRLYSAGQARSRENQWSGNEVDVHAGPR
jgi:xylulokinase